MNTLTYEDVPLIHLIHRDKSIRGLRDKFSLYLFEL